MSSSLALGATALGPGAGATPAEPFSNGIAVAQASLLRIAPGVGALGLATTTGTSLARVANKVAEAQATAVDLGLVGSSLTSPACDGSPGAMTPDQLPHPLTVDNRKGDKSASEDQVPLAQGTLGGGRKEASADQTPAAHAGVKSVASSVGDVVKLSGGQSDATARVEPGKARVADATVSVDIDIAGVVQLHNAQWRATHRTGENPSQTGSFSVASSQAGDATLPVEQLQPLQDAMNQALASTGITVTLPRVEHITSPNDVVQVTPLQIKLEDTPVGKATLGPVLNATREQREQVLNQLFSMYCQAAGAGLVADIGLDIVSGTGFLIIDIGGVSATSKAVEYENPFGAIPPLAASVETSPAVPETPPVAASVVQTPGGSRVIPPSSTPATATGATQIVHSGPLEKICETLSPAKRPGCSTGKGVPLILVAVVLTGGFAFLDWRHQLRAGAVADGEAAA